MKNILRCSILLGITAMMPCGHGQILTNPIPENAVPPVIVNTKAEPVTPGMFKPTWESLRQYQVPEWFRNAKFGIWACFGPQNVPEQGDWYARNMYVEGGRKINFMWAVTARPRNLVSRT